VNLVTVKCILKQNAVQRDGVIEAQEGPGACSKTSVDRKRAHGKTNETPVGGAHRNTEFCANLQREIFLQARI
jgi:hypothetical protein